MASPVTIQPSTIDAYIEQNAATANRGTTINLNATESPGQNRYSLVKFDFSAFVPAGATITLATLSLYCLATASGRTIGVYRLLRTDWVEMEATWNVFKTGSNWGTAGALNTSTDYTTTDAATAASVAVGQWLNETVTAQVQTALDSVGGVAHFLIKDTGADAYVANGWSSRDNTTAANRPKLYIEYTVRGATPTGASFLLRMI